MRAKNTKGISPKRAENKTSHVTDTNHRIVGADRFSHAIVIQFEDGICARFPARLLRSLVSQLDASAVHTDG